MTLSQSLSPWVVPGRRHVRTRLVAVVCGLGLAALGAAQEGLDDTLPLGTIDFPTSGSAQAQREFVTGVLALHSFWYEEARDRFVAAQALDPSFGMAHWGEAMTYDNALGTVPGAEHEILGAEVVARMDALDAAGELEWTERERGYANAVRRRFAPGTSPGTRREDYAAAMEVLAAGYPGDDEAAAFASLALMALPGFDREQALHVVAVASRLEEVYERNREHPGALHYLLHVYDTPTFAMMGLRQARVYAEIAPASSHALHMPSHIFRHLGMWAEVAASNEDSYEASVRWQERTGRPLNTRDFHALDWSLDAYLRLGRFDDARRVMDELDAVEEAIRSRQEEWGQFPEIAEALRAYYASAAPP
ncbi:hypothetical protein [Candidatus Rariloculus sp.]|uniref:hypothetical protein n=1 Tax=Candidatus Rariloculus sp. TaxID=3101265 RepID=UPI003D0BD33A